MPKRYATLEDVARAANLSRAQVSRALRDDLGVKPETRTHVREVARTLGYQFNMAARALATARSTTVGVIIGEPANPFHIQLARDIDRALAKAGLDAVVSLRAQDDRSAIKEADRFVLLRAAGAIMIGLPHQDAAIETIAKKLPCVYLGKLLDHANISCVSPDDVGGTRELIEFLISLGHRDIAHICGGTEAGGVERQESYRATMLAAKLKPVMVSGVHDDLWGRLGVDTLLKRKRRPTAIFAANDFMALGVINRLHGLGLRIPEDISVVGFDDIPAAGGETISLTTMCQDTSEMARLAVDALQARIENGPNHADKVVLPVVLRKRRSVAAISPA